MMRFEIWVPHDTTKHENVLILIIKMWEAALFDIYLNFVSDI